METVIGFLVFLAGAAGGLLLLKATTAAIKKRVDKVPSHWLIDGVKAPMLWGLAVGFGCLGFYLTYGMSIKTLEGIYVLSAVLVLSAVDIIIRKIPNGILIALLLGAVGFMALGHSFGTIQEHLFGMAAGWAIFLAPFLLGKTAGAGDIKYAAVIGFFLGYFNAIIAFAIMSGIYLCYVAFLLLSKKGNLKTMTALGPYLSLGFLFTLFVV